MPNVSFFLQTISDETTVSYCVKCLTLCTIKNEDAKAYVSVNGLAVCHRLLSSNNETIVGNSALILSNCFEQGIVTKTTKDL